MPVHVTTHRVRFNDTDALGHVNNAVFAVMCEQGRSELADEAGLPITGGGQSLVIVRLELDFVREIKWPGEVRVETELVQIGTRSFTFGQKLIHGGEVAARARSVLVVLDRGLGKAVPLDPWREALERYRDDQP